MLHAFRSNASPSRQTGFRLSQCKTYPRSGVRARYWMLDARLGLGIGRAPQWHSRGVKTKATFNVDDLPQGLLHPGLPIEQEDTVATDGPSYPTVVQQAKANMRKFEHCVVLTKVGGFYELYFEHAEKYAPLLNIKLAAKSTMAGPVPMAGFPIFQLDRFLKILVQDLNMHVAIAEEFPQSTVAKLKSGALLFDRRVTRIVTPGTLVDEKFMDPYVNNFLLAIDASAFDGSAIMSSTVGLAWVDLSTGEFFTQTAPLSMVPAALERIAPKEIVLDALMDGKAKSVLMEVLGPERLFTWRNGVPTSSVADWTPMLESAVADAKAASFSVLETLAGAMLLEYVRDRFQGLGMKLQPPERRSEAQNVGIDRHTIKGLEILETLKEGVAGGKGSLLHSLRRTSTRSGARLLRNRLASPSTSLAVVNQRLDLVQCFVEDERLREDVSSLLQRTSDTQRLLQKFAFGRGDADDLLSLMRTIAATRSIKTRLETATSQSSIDIRAVYLISLSEMLTRFALDSPEVLAASIANAIDEEALMKRQRTSEAKAAAVLNLARDVVAEEGDAADLASLPQSTKRKLAESGEGDGEASNSDTWIMRKEANEFLSKLHGALSEMYREKAALTERLRSHLSAKSLTLRWTPGQGHFCHVKGAKDVRASVDNMGSAKNAGTSRSTRSFYHPEWTSLGERIDQQRLRISNEEEAVLAGLREHVVKNLVGLRRNAMALDELDVACSGAVLADEEQLVRPILNEGTAHKIIAGRHPTVEVGLEEQGRQFVGNDCFVGNEERTWLITGPNMAGKSTFLRQNALISILAQVGLFVPAEFAEIGVVDQVFSRIGSADNLYRDQSTFMVEMLETANILQTATPRSFVVMDEIGRGTTPEDGVAVGFACLHHLHHINRCRTLFATHFHALADVTEGWERFGRYCTDLVEDGAGGFHYVHRLRRGVNRKSHALKVARMAGIPDAAIVKAEEMLASLQPMTISQDQSG